MSATAHEEQSLEAPGTGTSNEVAEETRMPPPEAGQFHFWLGEWDVTWGEGQHGSNSVKAILGGHVVQENFNGEPAMTFQGMSVSVYSPALKKWRQTWVDDAGGYLDFVGEFSDGKMVLSRTAVEETKPVLQRMVWYNIGIDTLDWDWQRSEDGGQTWQNLWTIHYKRKEA